MKGAGSGDAGKRIMAYARKLATQVDEQSLKLGLQIAHTIEAAIVREIAAFASASPWPKTGRLMRSFKPVFRHNRVQDTMTIGVYSDSVQAGILQTGGTITPKRARNLAIPVGRKQRAIMPRERTDLRFVMIGGKKFLVKAKAGTRKRG